MCLIYTIILYKNFHNTRAVTRMHWLLTPSHTAASILSLAGTSVECQIGLSRTIILLINSKFIHSSIQDISIVPLQLHYYSEALPSQHGYCVRVSGNCE